MLRYMVIFCAFGFLQAPAWANNENAFSFNHQVGYEAASQDTQDPLVGALLARKYSPEMGRFFFLISDVNRRQEANNLAAEDLVYNALSSIPVVGGTVTGSLVTGTGIARSDSEGLAYGDSGNLSVSSSRIDFLFHKDPTTHRRHHWPAETQAAYRELQALYTDEQIKGAFRDAISDTAAQTDPDNLSYLHDQLSLGRAGVLGCDPSSDCRRFEGFHRVSASPPAKLPVSEEVSNRLTSLGGQIKDLEDRLANDNSLAATDRSLLRRELRELRGELREVIHAEQIAEKLLAEQRDRLARIEQQTAPRVPSDEEVEQREVEDMLSNPVRIGGVGVYAPQDIRDELRLAGEAVRTADALLRLAGGSEDAQKFILAANSAIQVTGAVSTISKLSSDTITAQKGAMMLASATTVIGAVGVAMELFASTQPDPMQVALQQIMEMLGQILENQRVIIEKLEGIEAGQGFMIHQLNEISTALNQLQVGQRDLGISILNELSRASCERQVFAFDLASRIDLASNNLQLNDLRSIMRELAPETILEIRAAGSDYTPDEDRFLQLIEEMLQLKQEIERVNAVVPPQVAYTNPIVLGPNVSEDDVAAVGRAAHRLQACGATEDPSYHERRGAIEEIFAGVCDSSQDCRALSTNVDGVMLQDLMTVYLKASDALLLNQLGKNALKNDAYRIRQLLRRQYLELQSQEELARTLLPATLTSYEQYLDEVEEWIRYAIQIDVASVLSGGSGIGWAQRNRTLDFEEYLSQADLTLSVAQVDQALFENFWVRAKVAEHLGLGRAVTSSNEQLRYYWHAANWDQDGVKDFWRVAGYLSSSNWFSFDVGRMRAQLDSVGVEQAALNRFLDERRLFTSRNANKFLLDGQFRFTQFRSIIPFRASSPDLSRGYHHSNCWDFLGHRHLFRPGSVSRGTMPTTEAPVWRDLSPPTDRQLELYRKYLERSCASIPGRAAAPDQSLLYYHNANSSSHTNIYPESYNTAYETISKMINFSRGALIAAVDPYVKDALSVTRDDWEDYVVDGSHSTSIPDYTGWRPVKAGEEEDEHVSLLGRGASEEEMRNERASQYSTGLRLHRDRVHSGARQALARLSAARLAVLTSLELGYGADCINADVNLRALHSSIIQGSLVSGEELTSINSAESEGRLALQRLLFSQELVAAFRDEFEASALACEKGYYASAEHLRILEDFEAGLAIH